jgi:hypothetical protein
MTAYIKLSTLGYPRHQGDIELDPDSEYAQVQCVDQPAYDSKTQISYAGKPIETDGVWYMTWLVRDLTQEEIDAMNNPIDGRFTK